MSPSTTRSRCIAIGDATPGSTISVGICRAILDFWSELASSKVESTSSTLPFCVLHQYTVMNRTIAYGIPVLCTLDRLLETAIMARIERGFCRIWMEYYTGPELLWSSTVPRKASYLPRSMQHQANVLIAFTLAKLTVPTDERGSIAHHRYRWRDLRFAEDSWRELQTFVPP